MKHWQIHNIVHANLCDIISLDVIALTWSLEIKDLDNKAQITRIIVILHGLTIST